MVLLNLSHTKYGVKVHLEILNINFVFNVFKRFDTETTIGIRNSTPDGKRVVFLDYDHIMYEEQLLPEISYLIKKYRLGDVFIFKSSQKIGAYHVICLDKLNSNLWVKLLNETSVDNNYKSIPIHNMDHKAWVLRCFPKGKSRKPELIKIIHSPHNNKRQVSYAHALFLNKMYDVNIKKFINHDNNKRIIHTCYETLNYIKK